MEIIVHTIKDLNRYLDLGIYLLVDAQKILVISLTTGTILIELASSDTLTLYTKLVELKKMITSWEFHTSQGHANSSSVLRGQISANYQFDIVKHYHLKKYGNF